MGLNREAAAIRFISLIIAAGLLTWLYSAFFLSPIPDLLIFSALLMLLLITEFFPIPVWKGFSSLSFPLVYTIELLYGWGMAIFIFGAVIFTVNALNKRPLRVVFFTPAQLAISFFGAIHASNFLLETIAKGLAPLWFAEIRMILITLLYFLFNNLIIDVLLWIRPMPYTLKIWKTKTISESLVALFSILYVTLMVALGNQNRGIVDVFSYIFFFSPLVAITLISSFIARLQQERNRLKALYDISTNFNEHLPSKDWLEKVELPILEFLGTDAVLLFLNDGQAWRNIYESGEVLSGNQLTETVMKRFEKDQVQYLFNQKTKENEWAFSFFKASIKSIMVSPLITEGEVMGVLITGRTRTNSFRSIDSQSMATLVNQLTVVWKTKLLLSEREKRVLLEERNRIAREIHDGIAQTLAGSVMQLETAGRLFTTKPDRTKDLVALSTEKLRGSLQELRESIYALRPYPTERIGLLQAIQAKINFVKEEGQPFQIRFQERGEFRQLSTMVEKVIFDIFQESLHNTIKHAKANKVDILLSYSNEQVLFKIKDDGIGFSLYESMIKAKNEPHYGILNMNELAESLGAALHIESAKGKGTEIRLQIPNLEPKEAHSID
ncbi:GAF domain-containing sensor histidine kinase [Bacillus sp. NEB1478]|uniref:sensor histidine kinase n=1 Tax=Bacillus sp. NEB1478 TaxID=3073816 RepID=UPI002873E588|nr:GAF domain-containing sensor histidine kinase [Bacillus sp. NEB1478]WNB90693.1 GAF domain-containing sensor histidine kinase [Bacillus sp. NEB1478]